MTWKGSWFGNIRGDILALHHRRRATGKISAATGAMALAMVLLVKDHGLQYLFAATILTGMLQVLWGVLKIARFMKFIPRAVMMGFVNATLAIVYLFPY